MRIRQALLFIALAFFGCKRNTEEIPLIPYPTNPMIREFIGYGVVNVSFIHVLDEPFDEGTSLGFLRKRSIVRIIERRSLSNRGNVETWVKVDAEYQRSFDQGIDYSGSTSEGRIQGWLKESSLFVYDNEARALTAAEDMSP